MPYFVLTCIDKPDSLPLRMATREAHLAFVAEQGGVVRLAGPFLSDAGEMAGSMFVIEAVDLAAARAFNAADPYQRAGLFGSVDIRAWRATIGAVP
ncbi:MAG TPA: YciI family protein [Caulobacteraceae bacterium]|jgi:hypothetical protein